MNSYQKLWWQQAQSDHKVLVLLRKQGAAPCHQLHYLQMVTEKLGKALLLQAGNSPPKSHAMFVRFMRRLASSSISEQRRIAEVFSFGRFEDFENWVPAVLPLAYELQRLAPALAQDGPNPEYPWPQIAPEYAPVAFQFDVWTQLTDTGRGRDLLQFIDTAIREFPVYA